VSFTAVRVGVGRVLVVVGVLVLLFIPYLLWGTGLKTAQSQSQLRATFHTAQRQVQVARIAQPTAPTGPSPTPPRTAPRVPDPPIGAAVGILTIPRIDLSAAVVEGTGTDQLQAGPGHYPGTPLPGQNGNAAIAGHRTTYQAPFYNLDELQAGDAIYVQTVQGYFLYQVTGSQTVSPSDTSVVDATPDPQLTLTTCTPRYSATQRLVVRAKLVAANLAGSGTVVPPASHKTVAPTSEGRNWLAAALWAVAVAALTVGLWFAVTRLRRGRRWAVAGVGAVVWLGVVFLFFGAVAPLLPASY
jgi:sortase A